MFIINSDQNPLPIRARFEVEVSGKALVVIVTEASNGGQCVEVNGIDMLKMTGVEFKSLVEALEAISSSVVRRQDDSESKMEAFMRRMGRAAREGQDPDSDAPWKKSIPRSE